MIFILVFTQKKRVSHWFVKVVWNEIDNFADTMLFFIGTERFPIQTALSWRVLDQIDHGQSMTRNRDLLACLDTMKQVREIIFCFLDTDFHIEICSYQ